MLHSVSVLAGTKVWGEPDTLVTCWQILCSKTVIVSPGSTLYLSQSQFEVPGQLLSRQPPAETSEAKNRIKKASGKIKIKSFFGILLY